MSESDNPVSETVTLHQARELIECLAQEESLLLLSAPGVGKSETVYQAAQAAGLRCHSLLGTQIAPEDVSGVPRIAGERSVFCPPRVLLPETNEPFCLFLDELPACTPDIQKAFYSLLLERRIGEHDLPKGSWVVAAGNRAEDRALVRTISSALLNRVIVLHVRVDVPEWLTWAEQHEIDPAIRSFIKDYPEMLLQPVPRDPVPFSTPRAWALLSEALNLAFSAEDRQQMSRAEQCRICHALVGGRISAESVGAFSNWWMITRNAQDDLSQFSYRSLLQFPLSDLPLSQRAINLLHTSGLSLIQDVVVRTRRELRGHCRELDEARLDEIEAALARKGCWLGMELGWTLR